MRGKPGPAAKATVVIALAAIVAINNLNDSLNMNSLSGCKELQASAGLGGWQGQQCAQFGKCSGLTDNPVEEVRHLNLRVGEQGFGPWEIGSAGG